MMRPLLAVLFALTLGLPARPAALSELSTTVYGKRMRASSTDLSGPNRDHAVLEAGETKTLCELDGPGEIRHIWFTFASKELRYPATTVLRIYWDDAPEPGVEAPLGDFFAVGHGMRADINSIPVQVSAEGRAYNCFWAMPFKNKARIEMENQSAHRLAAVYYYVDWLKYTLPLPDMHYFHARYRQERPHVGTHDYVILETTGEGHYVGTVLSCQNSFNGWFGEGDDRIYIDGEAKPRLTGTGTEDYFNDAWGFREFTHPDAGCPIFEGRAIDARTTAYRWHVRDPIPFSRSLRFTIENKGWVFREDGELYSRFADRRDHLSSVAYWYQREPAAGLPRLPAREARMDPELWFDAEDRIAEATAAGSGRAGARTDRIAWSGSFAELSGAAVGDSLQFPFQVVEPGRYALSVWCILMPQGGIYQALLNDEMLAPRLDFYNHLRLSENDTERKRVERKLGLRYLEPGMHRLRFVCIGRNPLSHAPGGLAPGYDLGVDVISLRKITFEHMDQYLAE